MIYNIYKLNNQGEFNVTEPESLKPEIKSSLNFIEQEIIDEYLKKQKNRIGIQSLGNEIRFNKKLEDFFNVANDNFIIIKMTENKRSFFKVFLDSINDYKNLNIYFFVLERDFGIDSNLVDKSFPCINDIKQNIKLLLNNFRPKVELSVYVIEMSDFSDYFVKKYGGYSSIEIKK